MRSQRQSSGICTSIVLAGLSLMGVSGCGLKTPRTAAVTGKVELEGGDVRQLAGGHIEAVLASDRRIQAFGEIQEDGSFRLETVHAGKVLSGARKGDYLARIVLSDEDTGSSQRSWQVLDRRFSQFKTSGLSFQVPMSGEVIFKVSSQ